MKEIIIKVDDNKALSVEVNEDSKVTDLLAILFNAQFATMERFIDVARENGESEEDLKLLKEDLWHMYNQGASNILDAFIPEKELRPDITVEALLEMENKLIDAKYEEVTKDAGKGL